MRALVFLALGGCGLGITGESHGGGDNLPTLGAGPYGRLAPDFETPADEPFVVVDRDTTFEGAAALRRADGGYRLWFGMQADGGEPGIGAAETAGLDGLLDVPPHQVLDRGASPAVIEVDGALVMFFEDGGDVLRADSDDGEAWSVVPEPVLAGAADPTAAYIDGGYVLFVTRPDQPGVWRAASESGTAFAFDDGPAIVPRPGVQEAFDTRAVGDPYLLVTTSDAGRQHWGLWFTGSAEAPDAGPAPTAIGYAGSFDGERWERFGGADPVLIAPAAQPCVVLEGGTGVMFYQEEDRLHLGIAAAVHP